MENPDPQRNTGANTHANTLLLYQHLSMLIKLSLECSYKNIASFCTAPVEFAGLEADTVVIRLGKLNMFDTRVTATRMENSDVRWSFF